MKDSFTTASESKLQLGLAGRVAILAALFFAEKIFLNTFVDFDRAQSATGLGALLRVVQHWGFRLLVAFGAAMALFAYVRGAQGLKSADTAIRLTPVRARWVTMHVLFAVWLIPVSYFLFPDGASPVPFLALATLGVVLGLAAAGSAALALAPWRLWLGAARSLGIIWCYAAVAAIVGASGMQLSQRLWAPTAALTFRLVRLLLTPVMPALTADVATRVIRSDHFAVEVSEICSGLEGIGLILAFSAAWLVYFRREYIFPRALVIIPIGIILIFSLNVLRIAALMLIGDRGFPNVAVYGFHSEAGWIAFITVACGVVFFSRRNAWLNRAAAMSGPAAHEDAENPTAAYLMPFLGILAAGILSRAMSGRFEYFFALRLIAGLGFLFLFRGKLIAIGWRWSWRAPLTGLVVFLIWILAAHFLAPKTSTPDMLTALSPLARNLWIGTRLIASVLLVPVAEELAYRGYLMRRLVNADFEAVPYQSVGWVSLAITAVVFGFAHGTMWLPGIAAGLAYGLLVVRRGTLGEAVIAHGTTNALLAATVLLGDQWQFW
jgi:exosortase E/protease (VPEID-CTERM system)